MSCMGFTSGPSEVEGKHSTALCDLFANYFTGKTDCICVELDIRCQGQNLHSTQDSSCPVLCDCFQVMQPEDVDKILGGVKSTTCMLDPCPSWLIKAS